MSRIANRFKLGLGAVALLILLTLPLYASSFVTLQIGVQSLYLAILAMSLAFLAGYGGMVSLVQIGLFGVGGYTFAHLSVIQGAPPALAILLALLLPPLVGIGFALICVRTEGIYFLMITLALSMLSYTFALQNRGLTRGFSGINGVKPPSFGILDLEEPRALYYLTLCCALAVYALLRYIVKTPFGLALQAIRDNSSRMRALGFNVNAHRIAAFALAAFIAGLAGILSVWYNGQITPSSIDLARNINVLIIAVLGGLLYFEGGFIGAFFFVLITTFASSFTDRFNTLIGLTFLLVALFLPGGLMGLIDTLFKANKRPET